MSVVYITEYLQKRDGSPIAGCETFVADLQFMARHIRANAGGTNYPLRFGALAEEIEIMAGKIHDTP
jgi:hypothetical protein